MSVQLSPGLIQADERGRIYEEAKLRAFTECS